MKKFPRREQAPGVKKPVTVVHQHLLSDSSRSQQGWQSEGHPTAVSLSGKLWLLLKCDIFITV